ncbi:unnamed protein product [Jaminaea pallidilutea]
MHNEPLDVRRRLERRHRQPRLDADVFVRKIRDTVERAADAHSVSARQLGGLFGGLGGSSGDDDDDEDSSNSSSGSSNSGSGRGSAASSSATDSSTGSGRSGESRSSVTSSSSSAATRSATSSSSSSRSSPTQDETTSASSSSSSSSRVVVTPTSTSVVEATPTSTSRSRSDTEADEDEETSSSRASSSATSVVAYTDNNSLATSTQLITSSASPTASAAISSGSSGDQDSGSNISAGPIIGIVAAALAGVVIIAAAVGFLVKKFSGKKADPYDPDAFDKDMFRRESAMLPEGFESDDGHPSMMEHRNYGAGAGGDFDDGGYSTAGLNVVGGAAAYGAGHQAAGYNDGGRPRPPTMFARHNDAHAAGAYSGPNGQPIGAAFLSTPGPAVPPMAYSGGDPYSLAGVAGGMHNVSNPYAHLDRNSSAAGYYGSDGGSDKGDRDRNADAVSPRPLHSTSAPLSETHETSGRPDSQEVRSGTPDLPNVQQTYALGSDEGHTPGSGRQSQGASSILDAYAGSHNATPSPAPGYFHDEHQQHQHQHQQGYYSQDAPPPASLQVRNLTQGGPYRGQDRSNSDNAAYGGFY